MSLFNLIRRYSPPFSWRELRNSLLSTLALGLALGCALASSVAAQEGNIATAIALAGLSLVLAAIISITVVPRLLRRARSEWLRLSFSITGEGWFYVVTLLVIAVAAFNTGNNLIFIIFSATLSALVVSEAISSINLKRLAVDLELPDVIAAQQPFCLALHLRNLKPWLPSFSLTLAGPLPPAASKEPSTHRCLFEGGFQLYFPFLSGGVQSRQQVEIQMPRRGKYRQESLDICTGFPFGFVIKRKEVAVQQEVIVLPELELPEEFFEMLPLLTGAFESHCRGWGTDLYSIRDYSHGDNARFLDWKATAKTGSLKLREFNQEENRKCCLVFDNGVQTFDETKRPAFEKAVRLCANTARHFQEMGSEIRLVTPIASTRFSKSSEGLLEMLKILAVIEPFSGKTHSVLDLANDSAFKILFTNCQRGAIPTTVWNSSHVVFIQEL